MLYHPEDAHLPIEERREHPHHIGRRQLKKEAIEFFLQFTKTDIKHWAIENPVGCMNSEYRKPDQIVQPFWFGDSASKRHVFGYIIYHYWNQLTSLMKGLE